MISTISAEIRAEQYGHLLVQYQPRVIKTEAENETFLAIAEELMHRSNATPEEEALLDLIVKLIEDFESQHYDLDISTPRSRLLHLMKAQGLEADALEQTLGDRAKLIISGDAKISLEDAIAIAPLFHVKPELFLS